MENKYLDDAGLSELVKVIKTSIKTVNDKIPVGDKHCL